MVVVKHGPLPPPGKQFKVYLNVDKLKQKWYLRVTHTYPQYNQHFRAGTYKSKADAMVALTNLDPVHPKKGRQRKGTVDQYNGQWRVRAKHRGEHMHVGYFKDREKAEQRLKEVIADKEFLEKRYNSLIAKRKRKRESMNQTPMHASMAALQAKLKRIHGRREGNIRRPCPERPGIGLQNRYNPIFRIDRHSANAFSSRSAYQPNGISSYHSHHERERYVRTQRAFAPPPLFEQSETTTQSFEQNIFHHIRRDRQNSWKQLEMLEHISTDERSEESVTSKKKKHRILKRCMYCSKTRLVPGSTDSREGDSRLIYVQCETCKTEPVDVGWCGPAIISADSVEMAAEDPLPDFVLCNPKQFELKSPIAYMDE